MMNKCAYHEHYKQALTSLISSNTSLSATSPSLPIPASEQTKLSLNIFCFTFDHLVKAHALPESSLISLSEEYLESLLHAVLQGAAALIYPAGLV